MTIRLPDDLRTALRDEAVPDWRSPTLATLTDQRFDDPDWIFERKFDGERCLAFRDGDRVRLLSRNRRSLDTTYPELVEALAAQSRSRSRGKVRETDVHWVHPELVAQVGFTEWTRDSKLRHPRYTGLRLRTDKAAEDVVRETHR
ncbi:hypothetical protein [Nocardia sp. NPDC024068]|uniref:ATP dependent DNA ligase n=1 Tax=Nocardia sp. NPDC024068 TaxID=3157197 RepID=UPI0033D6F441